LQAPHVYWRLTQKAAGKAANVAVNPGTGRPIPAGKKEGHQLGGLRSEERIEAQSMGGSSRIAVPPDVFHINKRAGGIFQRSGPSTWVVG
jgi:hypothetical protein